MRETLISTSMKSLEKFQIRNININYFIKILIYLSYFNKIFKIIEFCILCFMLQALVLMCIFSKHIAGYLFYLKFIIVLKLKKLKEGLNKSKINKAVYFAEKIKLISDSLYILKYIKTKQIYKGYTKK